MRLLMLGGGNNQVNGIVRAMNKGHEVVLTDYYKDAPGRTYAAYNEVVSTFDIPGNINIAKKYEVDGIMTMGTDQPVYTAAKVSKELGLSSFITVDTAKAVTNKRVMKSILSNNRIPTAKYKFIDSFYSPVNEIDIKFPGVLKPLDSQGQRGVYLLNDPCEIQDYISNTLFYSRENTALLEEYYEGDEITVSCWINEGYPHILTVTDRETFSRDKHIGICYAHNFPSKYIHTCYREMQNMMLAIANAFNISQGPLYVQLLIGKRGLIVNEVACRIGGAYEDYFIPHITGFDILDHVIDGSLGLSKQEYCNKFNILDTNIKLSVQLFFAKSGYVKSHTPIDVLLNLPGVLYAGFNVNKGMTISKIENATARAGYIIITGEDENRLNENIVNAFHHLKICNENNENLIIRMGK